MKKIGKRVFAAVLAAALLFTAPGMISYAEAGDGQEESVSEGVTVQPKDAAPQQLEADGNGAAAPETGTVDAAGPETVREEIAEKEPDSGAQIEELASILSNEAAEDHVDTLAAEGPVEIELFGQEVRNGDSGDGWRYENGVLTLENFHVDNSTEPFIHFTSVSTGLQFTLKVIGENSIETSAILFYGHLSDGTTTITGDPGASLSLNGHHWNDSHVIIKDVTADIATQGMIFLSYDMLIDHAAVSFSMTGSNSCIYTTHSGLTIQNSSEVAMTTDAGYAVATNGVEISDSTLSVSNSNPNGFGVVAQSNSIITNSAITMDVGIAGIYSYEETVITNSEVSSSGRFAVRSDAAVTVDSGSTVSGIIQSNFDSAGQPMEYQVCGQSTLSANLTVAQGESFLIQDGAVLTIPAGVTLTNNGTMQIHEKTALAGAGTLAGNGKFLIDVTEDMISGTEGLVYDGTDQKAKIRLEGTITVCGKEFTADTEGWTMSISPAEVKEAGNYTATLTKAGAASITKNFTVAVCPHDELTCQPLGNGKHGGACPNCRENVSEDHVWEDGVCSVCSDKAAVKVEAGGAVTYYDTIGIAAWAAACGKGSAKVTLLADVTLDDFLLVSTGDDITFDGGEFTLTGQLNCVVFEINGGKLTIAGGTLKTETTPSYVGGIYGIMASGGELVVTGGALEAGTNGIGLSAGQNATVRLSGGTFSGGKSAIEVFGGVSMSDLLTNYGSANPADKHYAFYQDGQPLDLTALADPSILSGAVTVRECSHAGAAGSSNSDGTHEVTNCPACGYAGTADCLYRFSGNVGVCPVCGDALTVAVSGTSNFRYDGAAKEPVVAVTRGGAALAASQYTVAYENNVNAGNGTASVTVTIGDGQGQYTEAFSIQKATPLLTELPTAEEITEGQALRDSALSGGGAVYGDGAGGAGSIEAVAGAFTWKEPSTKPTAAGSGVTEYTVVFTPSDKVNYNFVEAKIKLTVRAAQNAPNENGWETGENPPSAQPGASNGNNAASKQNPQTGQPEAPAENRAEQAQSPQPARQGKTRPLVITALFAAAAAAGTGIFFAWKQKKKEKASRV